MASAFIPSRIAFVAMLLVAAQAAAAQAATIGFSLGASFPGAAPGFPAVSGLSIGTEVTGTGGSTGVLPYVFRFSGSSAANQGTAFYANEVDRTRGPFNARNTGPTSHPLSLESLFLETRSASLQGSPNSVTTAQLAFRVFSPFSGSASYRLILTASGSYTGNSFSGQSRDAWLSMPGAAFPQQTQGFASLSWTMSEAAAVAPIPEPGSLVLTLAGLAAMLPLRRRLVQGIRLRRTSATPLSAVSLSRQR